MTALAAAATRSILARARAAVATARRVRGAAGPATDRRRYHLGAAALAVGLATAPAPRVLPVALAAALLTALAWARRPAAGIVLATLLAAGVAVGAVRLAALDAGEHWLRHQPGGSVAIAARAELLQAPRSSRFGSQAELRLVSGPASGMRLLARASRVIHWPRRAGPGTELRVAGQARLAQQGRHASFDFAAWLRRRGVAGELSLASVRSTGSARGGLAGAVDSARRRAERAIDAGLPAHAAALERGMVLGEDERIDPLVRDDFRRSGLAHLLAVSGQNVMLLGALAFPLLAAAGVGLRSRLVIVLALICVYVPLAGEGASIQRAGIMGAAGVVATAVGRPASRSYALLLAAVVTLALNPRVTGDPGWQLSFAAVAGIAWLAPPIARALGRLPRPVAEGIAMSAAATLATAPLLAHDFGRFPLAGLAANLIALPAVAPIMWLGMLQTALGQAAIAGPPVSNLVGGAASALGALERPLLGYLEGVARFFSDLPWATVSVPLGSTAAMVAAYAGIAGFALVCRRAASRAEPRAREAAAAWRRRPRSTRRAAVALAVAVAALVASLATAPPPAPSKLTVRFLDVGQGDAVLIQDPHGAAVLFDGGPPEARVARLLRQVGVRRLSLVVATHQSRDHQGGLHEVIQRFPVDLLLENGDGTRDLDFHLLLAQADRRRVRRMPARTGQVIRSGALTVRILAPSPRPPGPPMGDPNDRAVVAIVSEAGFDLFLSADAESPSILPLRLPRVDAMKVPHHGSADPGLPRLLARLRPQVAGIEVDAHNAYGHPRSSTIAALRAAVPHVYRTDRDGTVTLIVDRGGMRVATGKGG